MRKFRLKRRAWGRADIAVAVVLAAALLAGLGVWAVRALTQGPCADGLKSAGGECVGVVEATAQSPAFDPDQEGPDTRIDELVKSIAQENERVRDTWEKPASAGEKKPYVRVALMLPYISTSSSTMSMELIKHSLAGIHTAQLQENAASRGANVQLLLANVGKDLSQWKPVVKELADLSREEEPEWGDAPLVGVVGLPSSEADTQDAADALTKAGIPTVSGVLASPQMSATNLFQVSPSNAHFVEALAAYLKEKPGKKSGYLVWDSRAEDNYAADTRERLKDKFGAEYELDNRSSSFVGIMGEYKGTPRRFSPAAEGICKVKADTVFYAGRDSDLPHLITQLSREPTCDGHDETIRILRNAVGLDSVLTEAGVLAAMEKARVVTVTAAATDPPAWRAGQDEPARYGEFADALKDHTGLEGEALNDGYAIMHHDAFLVLADAVDTAWTELNDLAGPEGHKGSDGGKSPDRLPSKQDVYNSIVNMKMVPADGGDSCQDCVSGASGRFGFDVQKENWPVCKPVPILLFPAAAGGGGRPELYRTFQAADGTCPT